MNTVRDVNFFTKKLTNCWCDEWLLVNENVILILMKTNNELAISTACKNIVK